MTKRFNKLGMAFLIATTALAGCAEQKAAQESVRGQVANDNYKVDASFSRFGDRANVLPGGVQLSDEIYVGATRERGGTAASLPARVQSPSAVTLKASRAMDLPTIAARLSEITGIQHVVSLGPTGTIVSAPASAGIPMVVAPGQEPPAPAVNAVAPTQVVGSEVSGRTMIPNFSGSLSRVLDEVSGVFDVEWGYEGGRVVLRDYVTRQYHVSALPTSTTGSSSIGGSGTGGGSSSSMTADSEVALDMWADVRTALAGLAGAGSNIALSPSTGMITVTAKTGDQGRIAAYIQDINSVANQQMTIDVNVLTVTLRDQNSYGIDLNSIFAGGSTNIEGSSNAGTSDGGSVNIGVVSGNFSLSAVVRALSSEGRVSVAQRAGTTTSNNRLTPINVVDSTSYVKGMTFQRDSNGNVISSDPDIETVDTGFQMQLLPRVMNNSEIMLQYNIRLSELASLTEVVSDSGSYQLPQISETAMQQQAVLSNGQTLIIAGFERNRISSTDEGVSRGAPGIGGTRDATKNRVATVIMMRPTLVKR